MSERCQRDVREMLERCQRDVTSRHTELARKWNWKGAQGDRRSSDNFSCDEGFAQQRCRMGRGGEERGRGKDHLYELEHTVVHLL
jgi:hypothetical protein